MISVCCVASVVAGSHFFFFLSLEREWAMMECYGEFLLITAYLWVDEWWLCVCVCVCVRRDKETV